VKRVILIVLTFDVRASARGGWNPVSAEGLLLKKDILEAFQMLKPGDEVAVVAFDCTKVRLIESFSRERVCAPATRSATSPRTRSGMGSIAESSWP
jgi:hypothetical protein